MFGRLSPPGVTLVIISPATPRPIWAVFMACVVKYLLPLPSVKLRVNSTKSQRNCVQVERSVDFTFDPKVRVH